MKIKNYEYAILASFLMKSLFFGPAIYSIIHISYTDSYLSIILSYILSFIPLILYYSLFKYNKNIIELNKNLGKIGFILNISLILFTLLHASLILWNVTNLVYSQFLFQTPLFIISLVFIIVIFYISNKKINVICRLGTIILIINIILFFIPSITLFNKISINELKPFMNKGFIPILKSSLTSLSLNIYPLVILLCIPKNNIEGKIKKNFIKIHGYVYFVMLTIIITCISVLGVNLTNLYQYPEFHILKIINIGSFLQRIESLLSTEWIFDSILSIVLCSYFINESNNIKFNKTKNFILLIIILFLSNFIFNDNPNAFNFYMKTYPYLSFLFFFINPLITLICLKIKNFRK